MKHRIVTILAATLAATAVLAATAAPAGASGLSAHFSSFELGFRGWEPDHFIQCEEENPPCPFEWSITRTQDQAVHGRSSLKGFLDGSNDDGTIWVERQLPAGPGETWVLMSFWLYSEQQSDINTWPVVAYAGREDPEIEEDFTIVGQTDRRAGWSQYWHLQRIPAGATDRIWVAFGFGATWETPRTYYLDAVTVLTLS